MDNQYITNDITFTYFLPKENSKILFPQYKNNKFRVN